jgi:xanthine/CO dehydrogenase XdhC/CoxF family maturation factor
MKELQEILRHLASHKKDAVSVLGTLVSLKGSSYRRPGARLLRTSDGRRIGSVSGGCLEEDVLLHAETVAASGRASHHVYDTTPENDLVWGTGQGCRGVVGVLLEPVMGIPAWAIKLAENFEAGRPTTLEVVWQAEDPALLGTRLADLTFNSLTPSLFSQVIAPPPSLCIFGAGDDAQPLAGFACALGWKVTVADPRPALATTLRFPAADRVACSPAETLVSRVSPSPGSLAVVMTHQFAHDQCLVRDLLPLPLVYLGLLGPKQRTDRILAGLGTGAASEAETAGLHAPVGLDLGSETPEEIALSILAEMQATLSGRDARPLCGRKGRIHA